MMFFGVWLGARPLPAQELAAVRVSSAEIGEGLTGAVSVSVEHVDGLYGADVQLRFDADVLQAVDANPDKDGDQVVLGDFLSPDLVVRDGVDNTAGIVHVAVTQLNPAEPVSGKGELFTVLFRARRANTVSDVTIQSATLANRDGEAIPSSASGGRVITVARSAAPPTPTTAPLRRPTLEIGDDRSARGSTGTDEMSERSAPGVGPEEGAAGAPVGGSSSESTLTATIEVGAAPSNRRGSTASGTQDRATSAVSPSVTGQTVAEAGESVSASGVGPATGEGQADAQRTGVGAAAGGEAGAEASAGQTSDAAAREAVDPPRWLWLLLIPIAFVAAAVLLRRG
jgi:hypothetical protein